MTKRNKIAFIGAGNIGGTAALLAGVKSLGDVVLYDVVDGLPAGKALDISHASPVLGAQGSVRGTNEIADIAGADVCVVTSGLARKPGMSRDDLVKKNAEIITSVAHGIKQYAPNAFVVVVTNPLDAMAYLMQRETGFKENMVVGMAGVLDSARYRTFLAEELGVSVSSVDALVLGGHGDTMVPVRSATTCGGIPVDRLIDGDRLTKIEDRVRFAGGEIVNLLKTGSAFCSPAVSALAMVESYLFDQNKLLACSVKLNGEFGVKDIYLGVPCIIGSGGVKKIIEIELSDEEKQGLKVSEGKTRELIELL